MRNTIFSKNNRGFALPTVVIAGLVLLIIGASGLQAAGSSTRAVMDQSWNAMAFEAKESGIKYIESCLRDSNDNSDPARPWTQTLTQSTNCQGGNLSGAPAYIDSEPAAGNSPAWRTSFSATAPANNTTLNRRVSTVTGKVEVLSSSGVPIRSYTSSSTVVFNVQGAQLGVQVAKMTTSPTHTCALLTNNKVYCAGHNGVGALGLQTNATTVSRPIDISPFPNNEGALDVVLGWDDQPSEHTINSTCILSTAYHIYCIGYNFTGNFGNGEFAGITSGQANIIYMRPSFVPATGSSAFGGAAGLMTVKSSPTMLNGVFNQNMCAIGIDDYAYCSGYNEAVSPLGNGSTAATNLPVQFDGIPLEGGVQQRAIKVVQLPSIGTSGYTAVGTSICVLTDAGKVYCHGGNANGQIGTGNTNTLSQTVPTQAYSGITSEGSIIDFGAAARKTCALYTSGALYCAGALPDPLAPSNTPTPVRFGGTRQFTDFTVGGTSICAIESTTRDAYCSSVNNYGQLGTGNTTANRSMTSPTKVAGVGSYNPSDSSLKLARVYAGDGKICLHYNVAGAEDTTGFLTCAGRNHLGQLGVGDTTNRTTFGSPYILPSGVYVKKVFINRGTSLSPRGETSADANFHSAPENVGITGSSSFCIVATDGNGYCSGQNNYGQLGDTTTTNRSTPVKFVLPTNP